MMSGVFKPMASFIECFYDIWSINITSTTTFISTTVGSIATIIDPYDYYNYDSYNYWNFHRASFAIFLACLMK